MSSCSRVGHRRPPPAPPGSMICPAIFNRSGESQKQFSVPKSYFSNLLRSCLRYPTVLLNLLNSVRRTGGVQPRDETRWTSVVSETSESKPGRRWRIACLRKFVLAGGSKLTHEERHPPGARCSPARRPAARAASPMSAAGGAALSSSQSTREGGATRPSSSCLPEPHPPR